MALHHTDVVGAYVTLPPGIGLRLISHLQVYNPNSYDVAIRAFRGQVVFAGMHRVPVTFQPQGEGVWLNSDATTMVAVPVDVPLQTALALMNDTRFGARVPYRITGRADVTASRTFELESDDYSVESDGFITREQMKFGIRLGSQ